MRVRLFLAAILLLAPLAAQVRGSGNINEMVLDIMRTDLGKDKEGLAMWAPMEFFLAAGVAQAPGVDPKEMERDLAFLADYTVLMVQAKTSGEDGPASLSTAQLRAHAVLTNEAGQAVMPLTDLPPKVESMLTVVRQSMSSNGGKEFRLLVFPGKDAKGRPFLASPTRKGTLSLRVAKAEGFPGMTLTWRTPLSSFVQPVACLKCGEALQAAWSYCPWCGQASASK